jgi:lipoprotein-releasing system permease protein
VSRVEWVIAGRYLRSRRSSRLVSLITGIAIGGVTVGVMALILTLGVMNGLQKDLRDKILVASPHLRLLTYGEGLRLDAWRVMLDSVRAFPTVEAAEPFVLTQGLISAGHDYTEGVYVLGIEPDTGSRAVTSLAQHFVRGDLRFKTNRDDVDGGVVLGRRLADRLSAYPGSKISMVSLPGSKFNRALGAFVPKFWSFEVTGLFDTGMYEYDNSYVVMSRALAQRFAGLDTAVTGLEIRIQHPDEAKQVASAMEDTFGYPYRVLDWQTQNHSLFAALRLEKLVMGLVLLLIVLVAAFNIVSTLTMVVADQTREIGILRAMGLSGRSIRRIFVLQGTVIGLVGTTLGTVLGLVVGQIVNKTGLIPLDPSVYFIDRLPVRVNPLDLATVIVASLAIAMLATIYPARQAARLEPVEAIRHE